jgi:hypothetical protein
MRLALNIKLMEIVTGPERKLNCFARFCIKRECAGIAQ